MVSAAHPASVHTASHDERGDLFNSAAIWLVVVLLAVFSMATVAAFAVIYYGDDVATPAWDEHSVPPPAKDLR